MNLKTRYPAVALMLPTIALCLASLAAELPAPLGIPAPAPATDKPYAPQPIVQGGVVIPLYPEGSPFLNSAKVKEAEVYNVSKSAPGRINWFTLSMAALTLARRSSFARAAAITP
jgi:hypothetical protein